MSKFRIDKLSDAIEILNIDRRTYHLLKRAEMHHVSSVISRGEAHIRNLKSIGPVIVERICWAVAEHLNIPRERLFSDEVLSAALSCEAMPFNPLETPVSIINLPFHIIKSLNMLGIFAVRDLLKLKADIKDGYDIKGLTKAEIRRSFIKLNNYLDRIQQVDIKQEIGLAKVIDIERKKIKLTKTSSEINLGIFIIALLRNERTLQIVELRAIQLLTLEEIAARTGGVTRERIRQIIDLVHEKIQKNINLLKIFCDFFEERAKGIGKDLNERNFTIVDLVKQCKIQLPSAKEEELQTLIALIRLLVIHDKSWTQEFIYKRWKKFVFLACIASPSVKGHEAVSQTLIDDKLKNKKLSYKELALLILSNEKRPMHWSEIADFAYLMQRRDSFNYTALYNTLMDHPDLFVRVDSGTYALVEWGFSQADYYPDIIASILKSSKKPLSSDTIYHKVNGIRQVKQSTLVMSLYMHPRFYRSLEKTYGLRVWLPPREKQTLRTPEWLVEDSDSYKRLEQAIQRGYDIENMIQTDLDNV